MRLLLMTALALSLAASAGAQLSPPNAAGITYGHVHLNVKDIELHKKLWAEHFGGVVVQKGPLTAVKLPNMLIAFRQADPTGPSQGTVMDHFGFKVRDIAEVLRGWRAAGYEVQSEFTGAEGFPNAYLLGPDGLRIELQQDTTLPVKAAVNHIHFMTPDYVKLLDWYARHVLTVEAQARHHRHDGRRREREPDVRDVPHADGRDQGPGDRSHRVRGQRSGDVLQAARSARREVRRRLSRGARASG